MKGSCVVTLILLTLPLFAEQAPPLPAKGSVWLDGKAIGWEDLKGKVVLMNVWTFG